MKKLFISPMVWVLLTFTMAAYAQTGTWTNWTNGNQISTLACQGDYVWAGTEGGIVKWNTKDGSYVKYTTADGLLSNRVRHLEVDANGNIWVAGYNGASRFDGTAWTRWTTADGLGLNFVQTLFGDSNGNLWVGVNGGVAKFDGSKWKSWTEVNGVSINSAFSVKEDKAGNIWVAMSGAVAMFDGEKWTSWKIDGLAPFRGCSVLNDNLGNIWVLSMWKLSKFENQSWTTWSFPDSLAQRFKDFGFSLGPVAVDSSGGIWISGYGNPWSCQDPAPPNCWRNLELGLLVFEDSRWKLWTEQNGLPDCHVTTVLCDQEGNLWAGTRTGLCRYDGTNWQSWTESDGLVSNQVSCLIRDASGNLWIGTGQGISGFDSKSWKNLMTDDGLVSHKVSRLMEDHLGNIWAGAGRYISRFDGTSWSSWRIDETDNPGITSLFENSHGHIWVGTWRGGISMFDGSAWTNWSPPFVNKLGFVGDVSSISEDASGNIWAVIGGVVGRFNGLTWDVWTEKMLWTDGAKCLICDNTGNVWIGCYNNLIIKFDGSTWESWSLKGKLNWINSLLLDPFGNIWAISKQGVNRFNGSNWETWTGGSYPERFTPVQKLSTNWEIWINERLRFLDFAVVSSSGGLWVGKKFGGEIAKFNGKDWTYWTVNDQISSLACDMQGNLWFAGCKNGLTRFDGSDWSSWTEPDGLVSPILKCLLVDRHNNIWAGTGVGISRFTPVTTAVEDLDGISVPNPLSFCLSQNFPNPFNSSTRIRYQLSRATKVELSIYNTIGQKVKTLVDRFLTAGDYLATWDGCDESGHPVSSGVYFYTLQSKDFTETKRMILMR